MKNQRELNKEARRKAIMAAAERVFLLKGFEGATVDDIAREAECTKRTLYSYFPGKDLLFNEIVIRGYEVLNNLTEELMSPDLTATGLERLFMYGDLYIKFFQDFPQYFVAMTKYETHRKVDPALELYQRTYAVGEVSFNRLLFFLHRGIEDGSIRRDIEPLGTALTLYAQIIGMGILWLNKNSYVQEMKDKPWKKLIQDMQGLIRTALQTEGGK